jgi:choline dehydrogenase-like flavoprotein
MRRRPSAPDRPPADVLVVGAGAAGAVVAAHLARSGFDVVCLEQGRWHAADEYPDENSPWELMLAGPWHPDPNVRRLPEDYPCDVSEAEIRPLMFNAVGGSTIHYTAIWNRLLPSDFRVRSVAGVADDWPLGYEELLPYYERMDVEMGIAGLGGDPAYPPGAPPPLPPHPIGEAGRKAAQGMNRLGWHWWPGTNAIASRPHGRLAQCARRGTCQTGCPQGAKASTDITHWPDALGNGARLLTGARVREILLDGRGRARGAVYLDEGGKEHLQEASVVVLAANGVGTPRLLLLSTSRRFPDGLANSSGLVGKRLMLHPAAAVLGVYKDDLESWLGPAGQPIGSLEFYETDLARGFPRGSKWDVIPGFGPQLLHSRLELDRTWGPAIHESTSRLVGHAFDWFVTVEDLPHEANEVILDPTLTDGAGIPAPRIRYLVPETAEAALEFAVARAVDAHEAAGAVETRVARVHADCGWHLLGTARIGSSPETSVCDPYGRAHDVPNLFVADGSVFVTAGAVNPTATICAFALRCAEHIAAGAGLQETPA